MSHWTVPLDHPAFAGHFPGMPILPGVVLLDVVLHSIAAATGCPLHGCEIRSVKFSNPAYPGDELQIEHGIQPGGVIRFDITAGLRKIASGSIMAGLPV